MRRGVIYFKMSDNARPQRYLSPDSFTRIISATRAEVQLSNSLPMHSRFSNTPPYDAFSFF